MLNRMANYYYYYYYNYAYNYYYSICTNFSITWFPTLASITTVISVLAGLCSCVEIVTKLLNSTVTVTVTN